MPAETSAMLTATAIPMTPPNNRPTRAPASERGQLGNAALATPTDLSIAATTEICSALNNLLADVYAIAIKTKNFHWHMSGPHFREHRAMLGEQAQALFAMTDPLAERCRKLGGPTLRSIGHIARTQRVTDNDAEYVTPSEMLSELCEDSRMLASCLREAHGLCGPYRDIASASLLEVWIDQAEQRTWFLFEASRPAVQQARSSTGG